MANTPKPKASKQTKTKATKQVKTKASRSSKTGKFAVEIPPKTKTGGTKKKVDK